LFQWGLKVQGGQNAMIKRETTDTIPLLHVAQQFDNIAALFIKGKHLILPHGVDVTCKPILPLCIGAAT
jgi:hypothetical protein